MAKLMDLKKDIKNKRELVNIVIDRYLPRKDEYPKVLHKALRHILFAGGKRIRPYLTITTYNMLGHNDEKILLVAGAIEIFHTYTLIHDDLPSLDNDDYRRGVKTSHIEFGEDIALLAGDALLTFGFDLLNQVDMPTKTKVKMIKEFSEVLGAEGIIGGQCVDILSEGKQVSKKTLNYIHLNKTAKLFTLSVRAGAYMANAKEENFRRLTRYGETVGLLFQIVDDILDIEGTRKKLGKEPGSDARKLKATYPKIYGLKEAKVKADELREKAEKIISHYGEKAIYLKKICKFIRYREF